MINTVFPYKRFTFLNEYLLESVPNEIIELINENKSVIKLKKGQILYHQESLPVGVYIIKEGKVKKYTTGINGKEHIFYFAKEHEILGHHTILNEENYANSVACLTDCTFDFIPKRTFNEIIRNNKDMLDRILKSISHEFGVFIMNSKILAQHSVRERTAISILKLDSFFSGKGISISRRDHSNFVGTSVESLTRVLHDFKESNIIEVKDHSIIVNDINKIVQATNII